MAMIDAVFAVAPFVRYVAVYRKGVLESRQKSDLSEASAGESDKYEELIVNPTLISLLRQRGNIDCGGFDWALVRYGHFTEFVLPLKDGHLSVGIEPAADALEVASVIRAVPEVAAALP